MGITRLRVEIFLVDLSDCMAHLSAQTVSSRCYAQRATVAHWVGAYHVAEKAVLQTQLLRVP